MDRTLDQIKRNGGQASVEYILLIVIIVALILGPLQQMSKMFQGYIDALFGDGKYVACLLETGELPGQSSDASATCLAAFQAQVQAAIKNSPSSSSGSSTGPNSNSSNDSNASTDSSSSQSSASKSSNSTPKVINSTNVSSDSGGGGGAPPSGFNSTGAAGAGANHRSGRGQVVGSTSPKGAGEDAYTKLGEQYDYKDLKPKKGFEISGANLNRNFNVDNDESKRAENLAPKNIASTNTRNLRAKELAFDPPRAPAAKDDNLGSGDFGFSMIIKWFLIACIIIAILVFVGGQAMQISKGGEN